MEGTKGFQWLEKVHSSVRWRLVTPNIHNPFDSASSNQKLEEYASDRTSLTAVCQVHADMDDTTILRITDFDLMQFDTEHPNLVGLTREDLQRYLQKSGVRDFVLKELAKFQQACKEEVKNRSKESSY